MGTYYTHGTGGMTAREFIFSELDREGHRIVACSIKSRVAYLACETPKGRYGLVCVLEKDRDCWGYKPVEETMGPYYYDAGRTVLRALEGHEPMNEYAAEWRRECWKRVLRPTPAIKVGDVVQFDNACSFNDGFCGHIFTVRKFRGRFVFEGRNGRLYRIGYRRKNFAVLDTTTADN